MKDLFENWDEWLAEGTLASRTMKKFQDRIDRPCREKAGLQAKWPAARPVSNVKKKYKIQLENAARAWNVKSNTFLCDVFGVGSRGAEQHEYNVFKSAVQANISPLTGIRRSAGKAGRTWLRAEIAKDNIGWRLIWNFWTGGKEDYGSLPDETIKQYADQVFAGSMSIQDVLADVIVLYKDNLKTGRYPAKKTVGAESGVTDEAASGLLQQLADWMLRTKYGLSLADKTAPGGLVDCPSGNCEGQMVVNGDKPMWNMRDINKLKRYAKYKHERLLPSWARVKMSGGGMFDIETLTPEQMDSIKRLVNKKGGSGIQSYHQGYKSRAGRMSTKARKGGGNGDFAIIHSSTTSSPWKTADVLGAKKLSTHYEISFGGVIYKYFDRSVMCKHTGGTVDGAGFNTASVGIDLTGKPATHTGAQASALRSLLKSLQLDTKTVADGGKKKRGWLSTAKTVQNQGFTAVGHMNVQMNRADPGTGMLQSLPNKQTVQRSGGVGKHSSDSNRLHWLGQRRRQRALEYWINVGKLPSGTTREEAFKGRKGKRLYDEYRNKEKLRDLVRRHAKRAKRAISKKLRKKDPRYKVGLKSFKAGDRRFLKQKDLGVRHFRVAIKTWKKIGSGYASSRADQEFRQGTLVINEQIIKIIEEEITRVLLEKNNE